MSKKWSPYILGDICLKITDGSHNPPKGIDRSDFMMLSSKNVFNDLITFENPRYLSEQDFQSENKRTSIESDNVLLTIVGTVGRSAVVPDGSPKFTLQRSVAVLKPNKKLVDSRFLMYTLQSILEVLTAGARGVAQKGIYLNALRELALTIPPLPEQKRIVAILDEAFAGISQAVANAEKNLSNARELFESYLNGVFTRKGEGWMEKPLGEVCILQRGFDLPKKQRSKGAFPLISSSGIIDTHIEPKVEGPGVVTGRSGSIGNVFFVDQDYWPLNTVLYVKEFFGNDPYFIYYLLKQFNLVKYAGGTGVPTLNRNHVHSVPVNLPLNIDKQRSITAQLDNLWSKTQHLESICQQKLTALTELKQSILQKAFAGELTSNLKKVAV